MISPGLLKLEHQKWLHTPKRIYKINHEVLPYEIEIELPIQVIQLIYSYIQPKYMQTSAKNKIQRMTIELNHKMTTMRELLMKKKRNQLMQEKREREKKKLVEKIEELIKVLEKSL